MERYEAILEQLKKAQSRGMETLSSRFDFVVQSLEELVREAKTSVQEALPQTADECFPIDELQRALRDFRDEADSERRRADDLAAKLEAHESDQAEIPQGTSIELLRSLDRARSQSELLKELLPAISRHVARSVVLVLRDGRASAWSGIGFADGERLRGWQGEAADSTALAKLLEVGRPVRFEPAEDASFSNWLTDEALPLEILLIPVVLRGKLMGAVYVDHIENHPWDPATAQSLVAQICWLIDTLQFRSEPSPALAEPVAVESSETASVEDETAAEIVVEPEPPAGDEVEESTDDAGDPSATVRIEVAEATDRVTMDEKPEDEKPEEEVGAEPEIPRESFEPDEPREPKTEIAAESFSLPDGSAEEFEPVPEETSDEPEVEEKPAGDVATPAAETVPTEVLPVTPPVQEVESAAPEEPSELEGAPDEETTAEVAPPGIETTPAEVAPVTPPDTEVETDDASASKFPDEPPPVQPVQPPPEEPEEELSEDEAQQEEARRFARLLVSEIKLYNEEQVDRGREDKDLYVRLKEDIDRSREMFDKRISESVRSKRDYFQDELVRILADGDADLLGM